MKEKPSSRPRRNNTKSILRLPDLEHAKAAVLSGGEGDTLRRSALNRASSWGLWASDFIQL